MSPPAAEGEGFDASVPMRNGNGVVGDEAVENVVISGAGPAGLMLAYVVSLRLPFTACTCTSLLTTAQRESGSLWHQISYRGRQTG